MCKPGAYGVSGCKWESCLIMFSHGLLHKGTFTVETIKYKRCTECGRILF